MKNIEVTKEKIIQATISEFSKKGLKFTMDDIANNLVMSKKTLYNIYDSKEMLLMEVADYCFFDMKNSQQKILENTQLDTLSKFIKIISALPEIYKDKGLNNVHLLKDKYPAVYKKIIDHLTADWNVVLTLLNKGIEEKVIRPVNMYVLKITMESAYKGFMCDSELLENGISFDDAVKELVDIIINGIEVVD